MAVTNDDRKCLFFQDLHEFFKVSEKILLKRFKNLIEINEIPKELKDIRSFQRIIMEMNQEDIINYFNKCFNKHENKFFSLLKDDSWVENVNMKFRIPSKANKNKTKIIMFPLKLIFDSARILEKKSLETLGAISKNLASGEIKEELELKLYLYYYFIKIKYHISEERIKNDYIPLLSILEKEIKIETSSFQVPQQTKTPGIFSGVFSLAEKVLKSAGINIPENAPKPNEEDFTRMIEMITNNDQVQGMIKNLAGNLKNCNNSEEMLEVFSKQVTNPEIIGKIKDMAEKNIKKE